MNCYRLFAVVAALVFLSVPVAAQASLVLPCDTSTVVPCATDNTTSLSIASTEAERAISAPALTPAELAYHRETVEQMERVWKYQGPSANPEIHIRPMTEAEHRYHLETTAHMNQH